MAKFDQYSVDPNGLQKAHNVLVEQLNRSWSTAYGDVYGPSTVTDSNFAAFDGTSGKIIKDSGYGVTSFIRSSASTSYLASTGISTNSDRLDGLHSTDFVPSTNLSTTVAAAWTPGVEGSATTGTYAYGLQNGQYYRMGNLCWVCGRLTIKTLTSTGAGNLLVNHFPYTARNVASYPGGFEIGMSAVTLPASKTWAYMGMNPGTDKAYLWGCQNGAAAALVQTSGLSTSSDIWFAGIYQIAT